MWLVTDNSTLIACACPNTVRPLPIDSTTPTIWTTAAANQFVAPQDVRAELAALRAGPEAPPPVLVDLPLSTSENV